jgi:hypothetical protein
MKQAIFFIFSLFTSCLLAQNTEYNYYYTDNYLGQYERLYDTAFFNSIKRNRISEIQSKYSSDKYKSSQIITFDSLARPIQNKRSYAKHSYSKQYFYDEKHSNKFSKIFEYDKHQKELKVKSYKYDDNGRDVYYESYRKGKLMNKVLTSYNDDGRVTERTIYYKQKTTPATKYTYNYYEDGSQKETRFYKKGKLKYTWHYDCEPKGTLEKAAKDTTTVCIKKEVDSLGRKITWRQETDPKNKVITTRSIYLNEKEVNPQEVLKTYLNGDTLVYWFRSGNEFVYKQYYKGKISWAQHTTYNDAKLVTLTVSENYKKGKLKGNHTSKNFYNNKGLIEKRQYINQRKKELKTTEEVFEYKFY